MITKLGNVASESNYTMEKVKVIRLEIANANATKRERLMDIGP